MKKIIKTEPFSPNVLKVTYDDGSVGFKGIDQGPEIEPKRLELMNQVNAPEINDVEADSQDMKDALDAADPMLRKYVEDYRKREKDK